MIRLTHSENLVCSKQGRNLTLLWTEENKANENKARDVMASKLQAQAVEINNKKLQFATTGEQCPY